MAVECHQVPFQTWLHRHDTVCVRRWGTRGVHMSAEAHVSLGWLPDGSWWVYKTGTDGPWVYTAPTSVEARTAAQARVDELLAVAPTYLDRVGWWEPAIATFEPGVMPARAARVPEWPPGHEPSQDATGHGGDC